MPRIRTVKPDFFRHELLQELEERHPKSRVMLVFIGLWTISDSKGRFVDRPKTIHLDILPFIDFDLDDTLKILESAGFIRRYEVDGKNYGKVLNFNSHQRITGKEASDGEKYPDEPSTICEASVKPQGNNREAPAKHPDAQEKEKEKEREYVCAEQSAASPPLLPTVFRLPTHKNGEMYDVTQQYVDELSATFQAVDVVGELRKMRLWLDANPKRRKTRGGMQRFIMAWLGKEQDRGRYLPGGKSESDLLEFRQ